MATSSRSKRDPMDEVRRILAEMKANGVTIHTSPAPGREASFGERAMGVIDAEARKLGMTYGDDEAVR
ncbi:hypothetical protein [Agromyces aureus]|uniref:hypothetical protein n=1 Tax=Agromyces aureus TaxID=453304 RepID=UPI0012602286|nr:hypothetical protein [Agromyces aureus]